MATSTYRKYFNIKKQYYPCVTDELIRKGNVDWRDFYPHPTFVNLLETAANVIERKQPLGIWVEGGYGTGKSYAALALDSLLKADKEATEAYFDRYNLDKTLKKRFCAIKERKDDSGEIKKIVTVHCYGTSSIDGDADLCSIMQQSILKELKNDGCEYTGQASLKDAALNWLSINRNKIYFNSIISEDSRFIGQTVDDVIDGLNTYTGEALTMLMGKIAKVGKENGIDPMKLDVKIFIKWLKDIIKGNNLQSLFFIWDEFTKYFENHIHDLTGFQEIMEVTETNNFCLLVVTHTGVSEDVVAKEGGSDKKLINRFVKPTSVIDLPDNIAFKLIGHALQKNDDEQIAEEWKEICETQFFDTANSRKLVMDKLNRLTDEDIADEDMMNILPIHPYAALILKYIASSFQENTRSMFEYIKNDAGVKLKDFQWYIDTYGPYTGNPFVTIDMLWEYFYQDEGRYLRQEIRNILSSISKSKSYKLDDDQTKILKTVLLMQAISYMNGDAVECFFATDKNLNLAFEGTPIGNSASSIAETLCKMDILFPKTIQGKTVYIVQLIATSTVSREDVEAKWSTAKLIEDPKFSDPLSWPGALKLRYNFMSATLDTIPGCITKFKKQAYRKCSFNCLCVYSKNDEESRAIVAEIDKCLKEPKNEELNLIIVDTGATPFGNDKWNTFIDYMVQSESFDKNDNTQSQNYSQKASEVIADWKQTMQDSGAFYICRLAANGTVKRERRSNLDDLYSGLYTIIRDIYPQAPEVNYDLIDGVYIISALKQGVKSAVNGKTEGPYNAPQQKKKLEKALEGAWGMPAEYRYWEEKTHLHISQIKTCVEKIMAEEFDKSDRVAISTIYNKLTEAPFGFMPCNLTAFLLGFVLKDYVGDKYGYDDGIAGGEMNLANLQAMVEWVIKYAAGQDTKYREKYIVTMTEEIRKFNELTCAAFGISPEQCTNIPNTRNYIRNRMKELTFPIWCVEYCLSDVTLASSESVVADVIQLYSGLANNGNMGKTESDIAKEIGTLYKNNLTLIQDLPYLFTKDMCRAGMTNYLAEYNDGELVQLAGQIEDDGQFLNEVKKKFDADSANWVWIKETADTKISEVIVEYSIIAESNRLIGKAKTLREALDGWKSKCGNIRVSYEASKNYLGDVEPLAKALYDLKQQGSLLDSQKASFLKVLQDKGDLFDEYYKGQFNLFVKVCSFYVNEFDTEEQNNLFIKLPTGDIFTKEKAQYFQIIEKSVKDFKSTLGKIKLKNLWRARTGTESPEEWSKINLTPIICMVDAQDYDAACQAFLTLSRVHPEDSETEKAISFLESATFYEALEDSKKIDDAFNRKILKEYAVLLKADEVRKYLKERATAQPHDWYSNPMVEKLIKEYASARYDTEGSVIATNIVDAMDDINMLKEYLKKLIQDDISVGLSIIKDADRK
ncbi:hypothetical protein C0033_05615 [Clostridium sp. chh4-2]|uniref:hypothetical protein n=1 Tax=Clostridium sp. chh4-2 TaxID=2067550 RepID=UPI000CCEABE8|nr:hypothetical protein [Clostridium sp. chh4-2]PNV63005.1 hypothetical protein C0033_05615 [Clostridium sp. chh4-2]